MSKIAHFFDINCIIKSNQKAWIVDKSNPNIPLYKIQMSEFRLIKSGIYSKSKNKIDFNGVTYYLPDKIWNDLKIISMKRGNNFSNYVISLQEFLNKDLVDTLDFEVDLKPILKLKNKNVDIYIVCSTQTKNTFEKVIKELEDKLRNEGIIIKDFYFLNENFLNQSSDDVQYKKLKLALQHSIGYKSDRDKFIDTNIQKYETLNFYDTSSKMVNVSQILNHLLNVMISNTDRGLADVIKDDLKDENPILFFNKLGDNDFNPLKIEKIILSPSYLIKKFESFKFFL